MPLVDANAPRKLELQVVLIQGVKRTVFSSYEEPCLTAPAGLGCPLHEHWKGTSCPASCSELTLLSDIFFNDFSGTGELCMDSPSQRAVDGR